MGLQMEVTLCFDRASGPAEKTGPGSIEAGCGVGSVHISAWTAGGTFSEC